MLSENQNCYYLSQSNYFQRGTMKNIKFIYGIVALILCGATIYLLGVTSGQAARLDVKTLERETIRNINDLIMKTTGKKITLEQAKKELKQVKILGNAYAQHPQKDPGTFAAIQKSLNETLPKFIDTLASTDSAACPPCKINACPNPEKDPLVQKLVERAGATTIDEAIQNVEELNEHQTASQTEINSLVSILKGLDDEPGEYFDPEDPVVDPDMQELLNALDAQSAQEALQAIESLEQSVEKEMIRITKMMHTSFMNIAENANATKLKSLLAKKEPIQLLKWSTHKELNNEITHMLYRAKDRIFTRSALEMQYYGPMLEQLKKIVEAQQALKNKITTIKDPQAQLAEIQKVLTLIPDELPKKPIFDEQKVLQQLKIMSLD